MRNTKRAPHPLKVGTALAATLIAARCGGTRPPETKTAAKTAAEPAKPVAYFHVDQATAGTLHGKIAFKGAKPARPVEARGTRAGR